MDCNVVPDILYELRMLVKKDIIVQYLQHITDVLLQFNIDPQHNKVQDNAD